MLWNHEKRRRGERYCSLCRSDFRMHPGAIAEQQVPTEGVFGPRTVLGCSVNDEVALFGDEITSASESMDFRCPECGRQLGLPVQEVYDTFVHVAARIVGIYRLFYRRYNRMDRKLWTCWQQLKRSVEIDVDLSKPAFRIELASLYGLEGFKAEYPRRCSR